MVPGKLFLTHPGKEVVIIAVFGKSCETGGTFLKYIAAHPLPVGKFRLAPSL
jgi:hypothetical protein